MKWPHVVIITMLGSIVAVSLIVWFVLLAPGDTAISSVEASPNEAPSAALFQRSGKLSLLRVHDVGTGFGPPSDFINVEVVVRLAGQPGSYGFQLRDNANRLARQGMLDLLRDAFNNDWTVTFDYDIAPPKQNGVIIRTWLTK